MSGNLCTVLPARNTARGVLVLDAVQTAPSSCVLATSAPDSTSTPRRLPDTALAEDHRFVWYESDMPERLAALNVCGEHLLHLIRKRKALFLIGEVNGDDD